MSIGRRLEGLVRRLRVDPVLLVSLLLLMAVGLLVLYSAGEQSLDLLWRQSLRLGLATVAMLIVSQIPPRLYRDWTPWLFMLALLPLAAVPVVGVGSGAERWLDLGLLRFQPAELMKLALPMMLAWLMHQRPCPPGWSQLLLAALFITLPSLLIVRQPDLGTALMVAMSGAGVVFLAGLSWRLIAVMAAATVAAVPLLWQGLRPYQQDRIRTFIDPDADPLGEGWNVIQSKIAVGSGGLNGKGWLQGSQSHLEFLPEPHTDFVLAVLAEEFGLVGVLLLLALYLVIILRGLHIARHGRDTFEQLIAGAVTLTLFLYVLVNFSMVAGLMPIVGVPLPLISYGGTSALTLMTGFGMLMAVHGSSRRRLGG